MILLYNEKLATLNPNTISSKFYDLKNLVDNMIWVGTKSEFEALGVYNENTFYIIKK